MKLGRLSRSMCLALFASLNSFIGRVERRIFERLAIKVPIRVVRPSACESFKVVIGLDLGDECGCLRIIELPVDVSEYPDVHRAKWLAVHLEMEGHAGTSRTIRCVRLHAGPDTVYSPIPSMCGIPSCRKTPGDGQTSISQTMPLLPRQLPDR